MACCCVEIGLITLISTKQSVLLGFYMALGCLSKLAMLLLELEDVGCRAESQSAGSSDLPCQDNIDLSDDDINSNMGARCNPRK